LGDLGVGFAVEAVPEGEGVGVEDVFGGAVEGEPGTEADFVF
jgi:hypothetical protein